MKRQDFLRMVVFILGFFLLNSSLSSMFYDWSRQSYDYEISRREFESVTEHVSVAILGDSHALRSVMAEKIEGGYNFAFTAESYFQTFYKVKYYLEKGTFHPDVVVLPIDLHTFTSNRLPLIKKQDPSFWVRYMNYIELGRSTDTLPQQISTLMQAYLPLSGGLETFGEVLWKKPYEDLLPLASGFSGWTTDFSKYRRKKQVERSEVYAKLHLDAAVYISEDVVDYFYRLLDLLEANDIQVVLVWYPITDTYYEAAREYIQPDLHLEAVRALLVDARPALILDYHDIFDGRPHFFKDPDHVNIYGAEVVTDLLVEDLTAAGLLPVFSEDN